MPLGCGRQMSCDNMSGLPLLPDGFSGNVRLFPLPDLVMFPHVVQPLRVFEPRYIALLEDALHGDQLIAMALLKPGWEADYDGQPPIHPAVCVGRVISQSRQADGCYNLLLAGVMRGNIRRELASDRPFRRAEIDVIADRDLPATESSEAKLRSRLLDSFQRLASKTTVEDSSIQQLLQNHVSLSVLIDVISFAAPLRLTDKQCLLAETSVLRRVELLVSQLGQMQTGPSMDRPTFFPPDFSDN